MDTGKTIKCIKCQKEFEATNGIKTQNGFVCNECVAKSRKKNVGIVAGAILLAIAVGVIYYFASQKNTTGFDGVTNIQDSTTVTIDTPVKLDFKIENTVAQNAPVTPGQAIDNLESFKRVMAQNVGEAQNVNDGKVKIPVIDVLFDFESANLSSVTKDLLNEYAKAYLQTNKAAIILIAGYTCNMGGDDINNRLSQQRAEAAKSVLIAAGVPANKIEAHGYGKSKNKDFTYSNIKEYRRAVISIK